MAGKQKGGRGRLICIWKLLMHAASEMRWSAKFAETYADRRPQCRKAAHQAVPDVTSESSSVPTQRQEQAPEAGNSSFGAQSLAPSAEEQPLVPGAALQWLAGPPQDGVPVGMMMLSVSALTMACIRLWRELQHRMQRFAHSGQGNRVREASICASQQHVPVDVDWL